MKRTQSAFALLFAFLISFAAIFFVSTPINRWIMTQPDWAEWISTGTYGIILLLFFSVYGGLQSREAKKQEEQETGLLTFNTTHFRILDTAGGVLIIVLILLLPAIQLRSLSLPRLTVTALCLATYLGLLRVSQRQLRIVCTRHHILIHGFDARIMIPDPNGRLAYVNPTGILAYDRIAGYQLNAEEITLFMRDENAAPVIIPASGEKAKQLEGLMAMHRIQRWYPGNV